MKNLKWAGFALVIAVVAVFNFTQFASVCDTNVSDLNSLISQAYAFSEDDPGIDEDGEVEYEELCTYTITIGCCGLEYSTELDGTRTECVSGPGSCWSTSLCF